MRPFVAAWIVTTGWIVAGWILVLATPTAAQTETFTYTVEEGDTCAAIAARVYGDRARYDLIHLLNPHLGPAPHRLRRGQELHLPRSPEMQATVARSRGRVTHRPPRAPTWSAVRRGELLGPGHQITTDDRASAELRFREGSVLQMRPRTLVIVVGPGRHVTRSAGRARLERGNLRARLGELAGGLQVETPAVQTTVREEATVDVDDEGISRVANRGRRPLLVRGARGRVRLPANTGTRVRPGERPGRPRPLPDPPRWVSDLSGRFVGFAGSGAPIEASWEPVERAARYRVEVARHADGTDLVRSVAVDAPASRLRLRGLTVGTYYLSISTIDRNGFESAPSPRRAIVVREAQLIAPGGGVHVPTEPIPQVVPGTAVVAPRGYRCGIGNEPPQAIFSVRHPGRRRIACIDRRGRPIAGADLLVVRARPELIGRPVVRRRGRTTVRFRLNASVALPDRLIARAPRGVAVGPVRRSRNGLYELEVGTIESAPAHLAIELEVAAGAERIGVATLSLTVASSTRD
ncbi:MAG: FecR domain-containing protein [Myxococcota bacterium]